LAREHYPNAQNVFRARERSRNRDLALVIDHYVPQPDRDAGSRTMRSFLRGLCELGLSVKFWPENLCYDPVYTPALQGMGVEVLYGSQWVNGFERYLHEYGEQFDYVLLSRPHISAQFIEQVRKKAPRAKVVYYGHDLHCVRLLQQYQVSGEECYREQAKVLEVEERSLWRKADLVLYPTEEEVETVKRMVPEANCRAIQAYCFDTFATSGKVARDRAGVLFVAGFGHPPNIDAAVWLVEEILPELLKKDPSVRLYLVGSNPTDKVRGLASEHVVVTGYVEDDVLEDFYRRCRVAVVPLRFGAGIKSKVVEALQQGLPLVTTHVGAQGLDRLEEVADVTDAAGAIAESILDLLSDDRLWSERSTAAVAYARERFSRGSMRAQLAGIFTKEVSQ
jgi:glycosyltransferase involved in cell wall biosynthesis